jgi:hypothetical protein
MFDQAVAKGLPDRPDLIRHTRIFQLALDTGWEGRTAAHTAAATPAQSGVTATPATVVVATNSGLPTTTTVAHLSTTARTGGSFFTQVNTASSTLAPPAYVIESLALRDAITVVAGQGGGAKTTLAIDIGVAAAAGRLALDRFL